MKNLLIILLLSVSLSSCKIYTYPQRPTIKSLLAVTSQGDTIQVSTYDLERRFLTNPGRYSNWRFNWNNNWYYGYGWFNYYDPFWLYRTPNQNRRFVQPSPRKWRTRTNIEERRSNINIVPRRSESATPRGSNINRGRSNTTPRAIPNRRTNTPIRSNNNRGKGNN